VETDFRMKPLFPDAPHCGDTMTVGELREHLKQYDENLPVIATWEGQGKAVLAENISVERWEGRDELIIDVET